MPKVSKKYPLGIEVVTSAIIENDQGKILLTQSQKWNDKWAMPGGHIEICETIFHAVIREVKEETGLKVNPIYVISWGELIDTPDFHRDAHFVYFDVYCRLKSRKINLDTNELTAYSWVKPETALQLDLAESYPETIKKYIDYKKLNNL